MKGSIVLYSIPAFFILIGIELLYNYITGQKKYRLNDSINNLSLGIGNQIIGTLTKVFIFGFYIYTYNHFALFKLPDNTITFLSCLVLYDFIYYWSHRWGHTVSFFWGAHIVHHQSEEYNLTVALRQPWFHNLIAFYLFLPLAILGFSPAIMGTVAGINLVYQFWIHTEFIQKMPAWFEYIFNTPSHHRVHHAINPKYIDRNHAGMFMLWDRIFGTFQAEDEKVVIKYGITKSLNSWNPAWANLHFYAELLEKMKLAKGINDKLLIFVRKPGWNPVLHKEESILEPDYQKAKYDADNTPSIDLYILFQFSTLLIGAVFFLIKFSSLNIYFQLIFAALILFSIEVIGGLFEKRYWAVRAEYLRWLMIISCLGFYNYLFLANNLSYTILFTISCGLFSLILFKYLQRPNVQS